MGQGMEQNSIPYSSCLSNNRKNFSRASKSRIILLTRKELCRYPLTWRFTKNKRRYFSSVYMSLNHSCSFSLAIFWSTFCVFMEPLCPALTNRSLIKSKIKCRMEHHASTLGTYYNYTRWVFMKLGCIKLIWTIMLKLQLLKWTEEACSCVLLAVLL